MSIVHIPLSAAAAAATKIYWTLDRAIAEAGEFFNLTSNRIEVSRVFATLRYSAGIRASGLAYTDRRAGPRGMPAGWGRQSKRTAKTSSAAQSSVTSQRQSAAGPSRTRGDRSHQIALFAEADLVADEWGTSNEAGVQINGPWRVFEVASGDDGDSGENYGALANR